MKTTTKIALSSLVLSLATGVALAARLRRRIGTITAPPATARTARPRPRPARNSRSRDYTDAKVQAELKDEEMLKAIADGVKIDGKEKMKGFKDELSADEIKDLVAHIRTLKP